MISKAQLKQIMPYASTDNLEKFTGPLNDTMEKYLINTGQRMACFLAQLAHESGCLKYTKEIASGEAYEGRLSLGNTQPGDGVRFKGRGLIQITGRHNYGKLTKAFGVDFLKHTELLEGPLYASLSAGWFWDDRGLNTFADAMDFIKITKRINGGMNGYEDRVMYFSHARKTFNV